MKFAAFLLALSINSIALLALPEAAYAREICAGGNFANLCNIRLQEGNFVGNIVSILLILAIILCLFFLIFGGIKWITSGGDKGKVEGARSTIVAAVVGLVLSLSAYFFLNIIMNFFTGQGLTNLQVPRLID